MKNLILVAFIMLLTSTDCQAQQIKFPDHFVLGKQDFLKNFTFMPTTVFRQYGFDFKKNPDVTESKEVISQFTDIFNLEDINRMYFEIYSDKVNKNEGSISITVLEFKTVDKLKDNMKAVDRIGLFIPIYFVVDKYVIIIYSDDRYLIEKISNLYSEKLGAKYYSPKK